MTPFDTLWGRPARPGRFGPGDRVLDLAGFAGGGGGSALPVGDASSTWSSATTGCSCSPTGGRARLGGPFDAICTVNSLGFWPAPTQQLHELRRGLRPGGRIAVDSQSRRLGATASTSHDAARELEALLQDAGYTQFRTETLDLDPPVVCVLAVNPNPARDRSSPASDPTA